MAQVRKDEVAKAILEAARRAFFEHGYKGATIRSIAKDAGVASGLVYSYYKNKEMLFTTLVQPVYVLFEALLSAEIGGLESEPREDSSLINELQYLLKVYEYQRVDFLLLIDHSAGTPYENVKRDLVQMTKEHIKAGMFTKMRPESRNMDDLMYHILAVNFMESIFEIGRHYQNQQQAQEMLNLVTQAYFYGVNSF